MKTFITKNRLILGILCIGFILRIWQLGSVPPSPDWDEAALGYNAYSILKTGRDEYGIWFPRTLRSFDDYKPPLYMYLTIPSVAIFGLDTWTVRLPSVVMGLLAIWGVYLMMGELLRRTTEKKEFLAMPYLSALLLAISPWHIQFSRIAFEANTGVALNIWGAYALLRGFRSPRWLLGSAALFALSLYAYHSQRIFAPLLVLLIGGVFWHELRKVKLKFILGSFVVGILVIAPLIPVIFDTTALTRLRGTSSLSDQTRLLANSVEKLEADQKSGNKIGLLLDNRRLVWARTLAEGYVSHFSLRWLFLTGDNARHHAPDNGLLYLWELPFLFLGMLWIFHKGKILRSLLFGWLLLAPVAASPTTELPHAIRTLVFLPVWQIFTAFGVVYAWRRIQAYRSPIIRVITLGVVIAVVFNFVFYLYMYFRQLNREYSPYWQYGYRQAVLYTQQHYDAYQKIIVSTKLEQPHMFFLFYLKYDPVLYLSNGGTKSGGFAEVRNAFGKYEFRPIHWDQEKRDGTELYIGTPNEISGSRLETIYYLDGKDAMIIADR